MQKDEGPRSVGVQRRASEETDMLALLSDARKVTGAHEVVDALA